MITAVSGHGNTAHSATQPLRLRFGLPVAIGQASEVFVKQKVLIFDECGRCGSPIYLGQTWVYFEEFSVIHHMDCDLWKRKNVKQGTENPTGSEGKEK